jgi:hypothetical protein
MGITKVDVSEVDHAQDNKKPVQMREVTISIYCQYHGMARITNVNLLLFLFVSLLSWHEVGLLNTTVSVFSIHYLAPESPMGVNSTYLLQRKAMSREIFPATSYSCQSATGAVTSGVPVVGVRAHQHNAERIVNKECVKGH